jgi:hypothetical protein
MGKTIQIKCDGCDHDLTYSKGGYDHCLVLEDREYGPNSQVVLGYMTYPEIQNDCYFCGIKCLKKWIQEKK